MLGALFGFKGRLSLPGFWEVLASIVLIDAALLIGRMYVADAGVPGGLGPQLDGPILTWTPWVVAIFTVWSLFAALVKRCHDRDRSGASVLWLLVPVIGWLWLLVDLFLLPGTSAKTRYGPSIHGPDPDSRPAFNWGADPTPAAVAVPIHASHAHHDERHPAPEAHGVHDEPAQGPSSHEDPHAHADQHGQEDQQPAGEEHHPPAPDHHDHGLASDEPLQHDGGAIPISHAPAAHDP